jgi:hypothetical protein
MAQIVGVKEIGIMKVARMIVVTKVLLRAKHFIIQLMHTTWKHRVIKTLKLWRLLQYVSVYKENIISEPQPVLS